MFRDLLGKELKAVFEKMKSKKVASQISSFICMQIEKDINKVETNSELVVLVGSWKDFIASCVKVTFICSCTIDFIHGLVQFGEIELDCSYEHLVDDILKSVLVLLQNQSEHGSNNQYLTILNKLCASLMIVSSSFTSKSNLTKSEHQNFVSRVSEIFKIIHSNKEHIPFNSLIYLFTFLLKCMQFLPELNTPTLFQHIASLCHSSYRFFSERFTTKHFSESLGAEKKMLSLNVCTMMHMLNNHKEGELAKYFSILRQFEISELTINMFVYLFHRNAHFDLIQQLCLFLVSMSTWFQGCQLLESLNFLNSFSIHFSLKNELFDEKQNVQANYLCEILSCLVRIATNSLINLKHHFLDSCISFVAVQCHSFEYLCTLYRKSPKLHLTKLVLLILQLVSTLSAFHRIWHKSHSMSLKMMSDQVLKTAYTTVAFVLQPVFIVQSVGNIGLQSVKSQVDRRKEQKDWVESIENGMIHILVNSFRFIINLSPSLIDMVAIEDYSLNGEQEILLKRDFSIPSHNAIESLTFGSMMNLVNHLILSIEKVKYTNFYFLHI